MFTYRNVKFTKKKIDDVFDKGFVIKFNGYFVFFRNIYSDKNIVFELHNNKCKNLFEYVNFEHQ